MQKLIVISGPSGSGKTSIIDHLLNEMTGLSFSISACSREKRDDETDGKDYYFLGYKGFKKKIQENSFLEWEEVYQDQFYGTLKSELERIWSAGKTVIFDVDVVGGLNIKKQYPKECLSIFIMPPSLEVLSKRLKDRGSESSESLEKRLEKAEEEIARSKEFDKVIINDNFDVACHEISQLVKTFIL